MIELAALLMLLSGAAHAVVNTIFKSGKDMMSSRALIEGSSALLILPFLLIVPLPHGAWYWLAASLALHLIYLIALVNAFQLADMSAVYPIMRGIAPVIAAAGAVLLIDSPISLAVVIGILLVSLGTTAVVFWQSPSRKSLGWALLTGASIAAYTVVDAQGVRAAPSAPSYIAWGFLTSAGMIAAGFALRRGPIFLVEARNHWRPALIAGALSILSYGAALWAYRLGDVPRLAALRETSILFGVLLAAFVLKEKVTRARALGAATIAAGAFLLVVT